MAGSFMASELFQYALAWSRSYGTGRSCGVLRVQPFAVKNATMAATFSFGLYFLCLETSSVLTSFFLIINSRSFPRSVVLAKNARANLPTINVPVCARILRNALGSFKNFFGVFFGYCLYYV